MRVSYYMIANDSVKKIMKWFSDKFGFSPSRDEVVSFCVKWIDLDVFDGVDNLTAPLYVKKNHIILTKEVEDKWNKIAQQIFKFDGTKIVDLSGLLTAIIIQRANYLPD